MRKHLLTLAVCLFSFVLFGQDEQASLLPNVDVRNTRSEVVNLSTLTHEGPIIISFWATWCKPCIQELDAIRLLYDEWVEEQQVTLYAVSIDDSRASRRVPGLVAGRGWQYEVLLDVNSDLKRALNVVNIPHTFIADKRGHVVYQHNSYNPGDEQAYIEILSTLR